MKLDRQTLLELDDETRLYQEMSSSVKFKQNLVQGVGAATVFGIAAAIGTKLFGIAAAATGGPLVLASLGIVGLVSLGIGCLYFGSKFYAESIRIDQMHQAKQITNGMKGVGQAPTLEQQKPFPFPAQASAVGAAALDKPVATDTVAAPSSKIDERVLFDRVVNPSKEMVVA